MTAPLPVAPPLLSTFSHQLEAQAAQHQGQLDRWTQWDDADIAVMVRGLRNDLARHPDTEAALHWAGTLVLSLWATAHLSPTSFGWAHRGEGFEWTLLPRLAMVPAWPWSAPTPDPLPARPPLVWTDAEVAACARQWAQWEWPLADQPLLAAGVFLWVWDVVRQRGDRWNGLRVAALPLHDGTTHPGLHLLWRRTGPALEIPARASFASSPSVQAVP